MGQKRNPFRIMVNRPLQMRFSIFVGAVVFGSLLLVWLSIQILLWVFINRYSMEPKTVEVLKDVNFYVLYFFFWEGLLALGAAVMLTLVFSRRVVGPIHRIQQALISYLANKKIESGELRVRTKDEFQDLSQVVNKVIEEIKENQE